MTKKERLLLMKALRAARDYAQRLTDINTHHVGVLNEGSALRTGDHSLLRLNQGQRERSAEYCESVRVQLRPLAAPLVAVVFLFCETMTPPSLLFTVIISCMRWSHFPFSTFATTNDDRSLGQVHVTKSLLTAMIGLFTSATFTI